MQFAPFADEFHQRTTSIIYCTLTTVSPDGIPRSRIVHPVWTLLDGCPVGWVVGYKTPLKIRHLEHSPHVALMYWSPDDHTVAIDALAVWQDDESSREMVWTLIKGTPPPMGWDPGAYIPAGWNDPAFTPLRLDPTRIQMLDGERFRNGDYTHRIWHRDG